MTLQRHLPQVNETLGSHSRVGRIPSIESRRYGNTRGTPFLRTRSLFRLRTFRGHCLRLSLFAFLARTGSHARPVRVHNTDRTLWHNITLEASWISTGMRSICRCCENSADSFPFFHMFARVLFRPLPAILLYKQIDVKTSEQLPSMDINTDCYLNFAWAKITADELINTKSRWTNIAKRARKSTRLVCVLLFLRNVVCKRIIGSSTARQSTCYSTPTCNAIHTSMAT